MWRGAPERRAKRRKIDYERYWANPGLARARTQDWRERNPEKLAAYKQRHYERRRARIAEIKSRPCADCGVSYPPVVMDLDHVRDYKAHRDWWQTSDAEFETEVWKCEVRCSNCHRLRHWRERANG